MSTATIDSIDAALFAALVPLRKSGGGPFAAVERWAGELPAVDATHAETAARSPAALLAFDGERTQIASETLGGSEVLGTSRWSVLVTVQDPRGATQSLKGTVSVPGLYALFSAVQAALNNLDIPGLAHPGRVVVVETRVLRMIPGVMLVGRVTLEAERVLDDAPPAADTSVPLESIHGNVNLEPHDENPFTAFVADTTDT